MVISSMDTNKISRNVSSVEISTIDTKTKDIMSQIMNRQQSLDRLSSDSEMSAEEKAKERQEIQKQIAELNRKLRMLRMEKEEETKESEKEQQSVSEENAPREVLREDKEESSVKEVKEQQKENKNSLKNIKEMLEAGTLLQRERIQQNIAQNEQATKNILEVEIKNDELHGVDVTDKKEKLRAFIKSEKNVFEIEELPKRQAKGQQAPIAKIIIKDSEI